MSVSRRPVSRIDIRLFGPPQVAVDGRPIAVDTRKAIAILILLAAEGRAFARDELAALLWPESDDAAARGALRRTLSTLRSAVGSHVIVDRSRVELDRRSATIDLAAIEDAAASTDPAVLADGASRIRGPFLAGFSLRDSPEFDDWRATRSVAVERTVLGLLDRLGSVAEAAGDLSGAMAAAARRLDLDPLDEAGHVRLMDLHARAGDRAAALRQYRACVAVLDRELGVAPLATTTARYEAIRDAPDAIERRSMPIADASGVTPPPAAAAVRPMVGRSADLAILIRVHAAAARGRAAAAVLVGEAGIGKTRLGEALADHVRAAGGTVMAARAYEGERSIAYGPIVDLLRQVGAEPGVVARLTTRDRSELARIVPALDADAPTPGAERPAAQARLLASIVDGLGAAAGGAVPGLIWIDDLQWADGATLQAIDYLARRLDGRRFVLLLAWRPEDIEGDVRVVTERLGSPPTRVVALARLDRAAVAELVAGLATAVTGSPAFVDRLVAASEGLPLYVVEAVAAGDEALAALPDGVRSVLQARLRSVSEMAGQVLVAASVIGRSFDLPTLRHASGRSEIETVDALDELMRRGLVRERADGYDFAHEALRDLASAGTTLTRRRLLHRRVADALRLGLGSGRDDLARWSRIAGHERDGGRTAEAAEAFWLASVRAAEVFANREAIELAEAALGLDHHDPAALHASIGRLRTRLGDYAGAIAALESAAAIAPPAALPELERALGLVHLRRGDLIAADRHLDAALAGMGEPIARARCLVDRSVVKRRAADLAGAGDAAREALAIATASEDVAAAGAAQRMLGLIALDAGDVQAAVDASRRAVAAAADDRDPEGAIGAFTGLAMAEAAAGDIDEALVHADAALAACRRIGDRHLEAAVENHVADLLHEAGREADALDHLRRAVEAFTEVGGDPTDPDPGIWMLAAS
jgi:DNA-binding SARP family transcriptional activator/tetratricopeptide (TPR) repeat protein